MWVTMINSVGEYVAGERYNLKQELADNFILNDYAEGELSRDYDGDERKKLRERNQAVGLG